jgi:DNA-binding GntR family transcriptional regulator
VTSAKHGCDATEVHAMETVDTTRVGGSPASDRPVGATHLPLRHAVLEEIRRRIVAGVWAQGERLFEDQIAADLGVSRNPVREALQALQAEGFVELEPRRGARVAVVSAEQARELFEVREVLEGLVAHLAARRRTDAELDRMRAAVDAGLRAAADGDLAGLPALNTHFHHLLAATARNAMLADTIERLRHLIEWIYSQRIAQRAPRSWDEHRQIVEAIATGDADTAERVARAHIARARDAYLGIATPT